jgi:hypothetical protein
VEKGKARIRAEIASVEKSGTVQEAGLGRKRATDWFNAKQWAILFIG